MAKKKDAKPQREMTKHELTRWEKQNRRQKIILFSGIGIVVAAVIVIVVGLLLTQVIPMRETVLKVNGVEYDMAYVVKTLKVYSQGQVGQIASIAEQVPTLIGRAQFIKEAAAEMSITVSDDEVKAEIAKNPQSDNDYFDLVRTQLLVQKLREEYFSKDIPTTAEQRQVSAMFLESENQANEIRVRIEAGEDFSTLAKEFSLDPTTKDKGGDLGWHPEGVFTKMLGTSIVEEYAFGSEKGALSQPRFDEEKSKSLGYWLLKIVADETNTDPAKVHVWAMLLSSAQQGQDIKVRLDKGEDFATLAKEFSQLATATEDGGDLGLVTKEQLNPVMNDFVFGTENKPGAQPGQLSDPIKDDAVNSKSGYWLVKVVDVQTDREISIEDRENMINDALTNWVTLLMADPDNKIDDSLLTAEKKQYAIRKATGDLS